MKRIIKKLPIINLVAKYAYFTFVSPFRTFEGSENYWRKRYDAGGLSGDGSYKKLAAYKAEFLNKFVKENDIKSIIEYGCGDGNQLRLAQYHSYVGFDVSGVAVNRCKKLFQESEKKEFYLMSEYQGQTAQLTLSLDVVYHLVEDSVYCSYMTRLFDSSEKYVIIYSSNTNVQSKVQASHVKHRQFSDWVSGKKEWELVAHIPNIYPYSGNDEEGTCADFYIYKRI